MKVVLKSSFAVAVLFFSACSFQNQAIDTTQFFLLQSNYKNFQRDFKPTHKILKIATLNPPLYLNTKNIIYTEKQRMNAYASHFWADTPSNLYRFLLLQKFDQSKIFKAVVTQESSVESDFLLESRVNAFEQYINGKQNYAFISVSVNLLDGKKKGFVAYKNFLLKENIAHLNPTSVFEAFEKASNILADEIVLWVACVLEEK
ncbi:ABC-type transport auxiliary lipoprotein family protein [Campylobacter sp. MIT 21-1685]|uniref:ABC-type transport auxiliary lipoprotein family protein n=1 Tax=unclassified Campylobacter TaxID=2593542 RepID=UPI00224AD1EA|nr:MULTISPECIES: ABC-type transport auxiliary lipoprotein family protein [unclassified Campylobacter]MCX2683354.1 ABC-type transport auxiliary lipoprotein family protein [Campylobacter sp. MIT 21-1684]MCX2751591.1 ABC-type transport auxiliary lipoprotein family protein [Campylobacter sp. MIT 21-1682]MCX2807790.1 ABC-type transport auxiliary lipoprotein family protein [Campylobacter sp. MIT 21-1685]